MKMILSVQTLMFFLFLSGALCAQTKVSEELRTDNHDLRGVTPVFEVRSHQKEHDSLALLQAGKNQYMMDVSEGSRLKVSSSFAKKADEKFVKNFIHIKYGMKKRGDVACHSVFTLSLRGETEDVCRHEKDKVGAIASIINEFKQELKIK